MGKKKNRPRPEPETLGLPLTGVESHAHLDLKDYEEGVGLVIERAVRAGVKAIGNVFLGPGAYEKNAPLFKDQERVFFLLGIHPHDADACGPDELDRMRTAFRSDSRLKGLGEIGLDYYWDRSPRPKQQQAFKDQLALARELDLPVIIHSREAEDDALAILDDMGFKDRPVLWHCFGGSPDLARALLGRGFYLSIPGTVTFPKNTPLRQAAAEIPLERMMLETDCPYLTPEPYRGKRNEPAYLAFTAACIAQLRNIPPAGLWTECGRTATRFFSL